MQSPSLAPDGLLYYLGGIMAPTPHRGHASGWLEPRGFLLSCEHGNYTTAQGKGKERGRDVGAPESPAEIGAGHLSSCNGTGGMA